MSTTANLQQNRAQSLFRIEQKSRIQVAKSIANLVSILLQFLSINSDKNGIFYLECWPELDP